MARIVLINPPIVERFNRTGSRWPGKTKSDSICYPWWLCYAGGWLEKHGHKIKIIDAPAQCLNDLQVLDLIKDFEPDFAVIDTSTPSIISDTIFAKQINGLLMDIKTVMVGPHASALPNETIAMARADYLIKGEYEIRLLQLADGLPLPSIIEGIPFEELDALPFASEIYRNHLNIKNYFFWLAHYPLLQIMGGRGCAYHCNYCSWAHVLTGRRVRYRSVDNYVDELEYIRKELPYVKDVVEELDTFTYNHARVLEICREIKRRGLELSWICNVRADVPLNILKEMKSAGCRIVIVGYESGNQQVLDRAKKAIRLDDMLCFSKNVRKAGLESMGCFMIGLLDETEETARQTFEFAKKVDPDTFFFAPATPFAGTEFYDICRNEGFLTSTNFEDWTDREGYLKGVINYPMLKAERITALMDEFNFKFAFRRHYMAKTLKKVLRHPRLEGKRVGHAFLNGVKYYLEKGK